MEILKTRYIAPFLAILGGSFLFLMSPCLAEQIAISGFRGLNNNDPSVSIEPQDAQDLLNVDVQPGGKSVKKRSGYGLYKSLGTGQALHGGTHFFDVSGSDVQIWGSSTSLYGIVSDAQATQLISSVTLNSTWDCADTQGYTYCVDSDRDAFIKTNGSTMTWYATPFGTMVEATSDRVVVAGVSTAKSSLYFSGSGDFTNFTPGLNDTDPFVEAIASGGSRLTHIRFACQRLLWWKDQSFGSLLGDNQSDVEISIISDNIGTNDNSSAIDPAGNVWFRGSDAHIYRYDCSGLERMSVPITPSAQLSKKRVSNSWTQTSASDFNGGYLLYTDTTTSPGSVLLQGYYPVIQNPSFEDYDLSTQEPSSWTVTNGGFGYWNTDNGVNPTAQSGSRKARAGSPPGVSTCSFALLQSDQSTVISSMTIASQGTDIYTWVEQTISISTSIVGQIGYLRFRNDEPSGYGSDDLVSSSFAIGGTIVFYSNRHYRSTGGDYPCSIDNVSALNYFISTGTYYSAVRNAPDLSSWDTFLTSKQDNDGTHTFYARSSTNTFTVASSTPSWIAQTIGSVVSASTGTYFQMRDDFARTVSSRTPSLDDLTFNWFEGNNAGQAFLTYFDNAIWVSVAYGGGQATNNYIFRYDLINDGWTLYNFGANGLLVQNNNLYFGDVSTGGKIFRYGSGTSDNGTSINAYWKTKDFVGPDPWSQNEYKRIDTVFSQNENQTATVSYAVDNSTSPTSYPVNLSNTTKPYIVHGKLLPAGKFGNLFNLKVGDTSDSNRWEFLGARIDFTVLPYRPTR